MKYLMRNKGPILTSPAAPVSGYFESLGARLFPRKPRVSAGFSAEDSVWTVTFFFLGITSRIIRIQYPKCPVLDEKRCGISLNHYANGTFFDDSRPPLAMLVLAGVAKFAGYNRKYSFENDYDTMFYVILRSISVFFGSLCPPLTYVTSRYLRLSVLASIAAAIIVSGDLFLIIQERYFGTEGIAHPVSILAIFSLFVSKRNGSLEALVFEGICVGLAISCDDALRGIFILSIINEFPLKMQSLRSCFEGSGHSITRSIILSVVVATVYLTVYSIHLAVLPFRGTGTENLPVCIQDSLLDAEKPNWMQRAEAPSSIVRAIALVCRLPDQPDENQTPSWSYAFTHIAVHNDGERQLMIITNPLIWLPILIAVVGNIVRVALTGDLDSDMTAMVIGYLVSYSRRLLDHSLAFFFGVFQLVMLVDNISNEQIRGFILYGLIHVAITAFALWNPLVYGRIM